MQDARCKDARLVTRPVAKQATNESSGTKYREIRLARGFAQSDGLGATTRMRPQAEGPAEFVRRLLSMQGIRDIKDPTPRYQGTRLRATGPVIAYSSSIARAQSTTDDPLNRCCSVAHPTRRLRSRLSRAGCSDDDGGGWQREEGCRGK